MKKKLFALSLVLSLLTGMLAGCGTSDQSAAQQTPQSSQAEASTAEPPKTESESVSISTEASVAESTLDEEASDFVPAEPLSYPLSDGSVTFTILHSEPALGPMTGQMNMSTYGDFDTIAAGTEAIGVTPQWQALSSATADQQFNLIIASGDYPDVISGVDRYYSGGFTKALEDEVILALDDYLETDMPEYWNLVHEDSELLRAVTNDDGNFLAWYSIFDRVIVNEGYFIRKDWCDLVNVPVPKTVEELDAFAHAIKSELDLDSVILLGKELETFASAWGIGRTTASGSGFAYHREGDQLVADVQSEAYHEFVAQLHDWYQDGIVSRNFTEIDTNNFSGDMEQELAANRTGICNTMVNSLDNLMTLSSDPDFALAPMVITKDGGNIHTGAGERQFDSCCLTAACDEDRIPYVLGWMNYWYTHEGAMAAAYGVEGLDYQENPDGSITYLDNIMNNAYGYPPMLFSRARCFSGAAFGLMYQDRTTPFYTDAQLNAIETWTQRTDNDGAVPQSLSLNTQESEVVAAYATDLATYVAEEIPKFVIGERDMSQWDDFVSTCEGMQLAELLGAYQDAYDRYTA